MDIATDIAMDNAIDIAIDVASDSAFDIASDTAIDITTDLAIDIASDTAIDISSDAAFDVVDSPAQVGYVMETNKLQGFFKCDLYYAFCVVGRIAFFKSPSNLCKGSQSPR